MISLPLEIIPIEDDGFHLQLTVQVNGINANFLLDTGASRTVFDKSRIERFAPGIITTSNTERRSTGLGTSSMEIFNGMIERLSLGSIHVFGIDAAFLDLSNVNDSYSYLGISKIDGVLGNDILFRFNAVINLKEKVLSLTPEED